MTSIDIDTIAGPDGDSFKFENVGDIAKGVIAHVDTSERENRFNGNMELVLRVALEQDDGETIIIWPVLNTNVDGDGYASRMAKAIAAAARAAGATKIEAGGTLAVKFDREQATEKGNPAKVYVAEYHPPATPAADDDADDGAVTGLI